MPYDKVYEKILVRIVTMTILADLIEFPLPYFEVILGMDGLGKT